MSAKLPSQGPLDINGCPRWACIAIDVRPGAASTRPARGANQGAKPPRAGTLAQNRAEDRPSVWTVTLRVTR
ncbi:hypothetical protein GCM10010211_73990 [Streptomyces albospinus]|uniref:Transposase n=1 Tax=Streptomyces albospinus TaxID=285515 RepID=A0ABQ2VLX4_9ACTN|nr:hypothetical protein GCM10010211_73990 [Streptomyces albospinus]